MSECSHDCSSCGSDCGERTASNSFSAALNAASSVGRVIAVVSGKGGVGKSSVTALLALAMAKRGKRVAILDADVTGPSIPKAFGVTSCAEGCDKGIIPAVTRSGIKVMSLNMLLENETDPVVWRGPVIGGTVKQFWTDVYWGDVDCMFIDMPPGTGDVPLTVFQSIPVSGAVIVTTPQSLVGMIVEKSVKMARLMNVEIKGIVENMSYLVCPDCGKRINIFGESRIDEIARANAIGAVAKLPMNPAFSALCDAGRVEEADTSGVEEIIKAIE